MDNTTPDIRSRIMRANKSMNTHPEIQARSLIHKLGYRFRVHYKGLPGKPDIAFTKKKKAIFINGCFWHQHEIGCICTHSPQSNREYWRKKFEYNKIRDSKVHQKILDMGWSILVIWECELIDMVNVEKKIVEFLEN